jgi:hypothetical protein
MQNYRMVVHTQHGSFYGPAVEMTEEEREADADRLRKIKNIQFVDNNGYTVCIPESAVQHCLFLIEPVHPDTL